MTLLLPIPNMAASSKFNEKEHFKEFLSMCMLSPLHHTLKTNFLSRTLLGRNRSLEVFYRWDIVVCDKNRW